MTSHRRESEGHWWHDGHAYGTVSHIHIHMLISYTHIFNKHHQGHLRCSQNSCFLASPVFADITIIRMFCILILFPSAESPRNPLCFIMDVPVWIFRPDPPVDKRYSYVGETDWPPDWDTFYLFSFLILTLISEVISTECKDHFIGCNCSHEPNSSWFSLDGIKCLQEMFTKQQTNFTYIQK